ncbi:MAG: hypothetical protein HMLIMOIP_002386 [Candidatus Nitrosomirales archaeon]|jgi:hypothetical protein
MALFYDNEEQRDNEIIHFINEGLAEGQLCIYGTIHVSDKEYFETLTSRIINYEENVKKGNLMVVDFIPFYLAALKHDLTPYKEVQKQLEDVLKNKKDMKVRYVGDVTGYLFKNGYFYECIMIEGWWQNIHLPLITTLCLFDKSLMDKSPFDNHKNKVIHTHDVVLDSN